MKRIKEDYTFKKPIWCIFKGSYYNQEQFTNERSVSVLEKTGQYWYLADGKLEGQQMFYRYDDDFHEMTGNSTEELIMRLTIEEPNIEPVIWDKFNAFAPLKSKTNLNESFAFSTELISYLERHEPEALTEYAS